MNFGGVLLQGRLVADDVTPAGTFNVTDDNTRLSDCTPPEVSVVSNHHILSTYFMGLELKKLFESSIMYTYHHSDYETV